MSTETDTAARVEELAARMTELRDAYYRGEPLVADADYDALEDELRALLAEHPELTPDPNPLEQVGATAVLHAPVRHSRPMLSLQKATTPEQVADFFARFPGQPVVVMPKLDGLSLAVVYERGRLARAVTRGDGTTGDDVTPLVRAMTSGIPDRIEADGTTEVRGELVMLRSTFAAYNAEHPDKPLINPRNAAAGTIRAKDPATVKGREMRFFAFDLHVEDGASADLEKALRDLGFDAADMRHCDDAEAAQGVIAEIEATRNELDYDLDGAVLRLADRGAYAAAGTRSNSPRGALAFKFAAEEKTTLLADVVWDVGKIGKVAPVAVLEPVFVGGTTVTRATLANQEVIRARDVRIGDTVLVRRAGDVIPFVAGVLDASKRTGDEREIEPPSRVPVVRAAADRAGQQPRALLHQRRLPGPDRAAADPLGVALRRRHRGGRAGLDRAAQRAQAARAGVGLLRADARAAARVRGHRRHLGRPHDRLDQGHLRRRPAAGADRAGDPDGVRGHGDAPVPGGLQDAGGRRRRGEEALQQVEDIGPKVAAQPARPPQPRDHARGARAAARARRRPRRARGGPAARRSAPTRRWPARPSSSPARSPTRAAARRSRGRRSSGCASARGRRRPRRCRRTPTC